MNVGPWFDGFPEPIKILLLLISGLTSLCTAGAALLHQWSCLRRTRVDASVTTEMDVPEE